MGHEYKISLNIQETGEKIVLAGEFKNEEWELLEEYVQYATELINTQFVKNGMPSSLKLNWDRETGMTATTQLPPWDDVIVFLHKFRPLCLQSERTNFYKIFNLLSREISHPYFRNLISEEHKTYSGKRLQSQFKMYSNEVLLNSEKLLFDWLNSYEYHRDKEKREFIESLHVVFPLEATQVLFLILLSDKTEAIHNIAVWLRVILGKQNSAEGRLRRPE